MHAFRLSQVGKMVVQRYKETHKDQKPTPSRSPAALTHSQETTDSTPVVNIDTIKQNILSWDFTVVSEWPWDLENFVQMSVWHLKQGNITLVAKWILQILEKNRNIEGGQNQNDMKQDISIPDVICMIVVQVIQSFTHAPDSSRLRAYTIPTYIQRVWRSLLKHVGYDAHLVFTNIIDPLWTPPVANANISNIVVPLSMIIDFLKGVTKGNLPTFEKVMSVWHSFCATPMESCFKA
eukprot:TRINITY_DN2167_c0_g3_i2.p1 TRINITY_DN2167_c0_g3~~TRINITY_DN2167_c0_g3_i2.p1  ORF type:complete len:236 (-),score=34.14 TRINITY_DN2167_c0_g3_i2:166-873(-)